MIIEEFGLNEKTVKKLTDEIEGIPKKQNNNYTRFDGRYESRAYSARKLPSIQLGPIMDDIKTSIILRRRKSFTDNEPINFKITSGNKVNLIGNQVDIDNFIAGLL
jgi:hypothetical protein